MVEDQRIMQTALFCDYKSLSCFYPKYEELTNFDKTTLLTTSSTHYSTPMQLTHSFPSTKQSKTKMRDTSKFVKTI